LTDGQGRVVDFKNVVVIMTSNIGSEFLGMYAGREMSEGEWENVKNKVIEEMRKHFRPEFLNRIDDIVVFHSLSMNDLKNIVEILLKQVAKRLEDRHISIELSDKAKEFLVNEGYDPKYGARPLKRTIQRRVLDPLALDVLNGRIRDGDHVVVDVEDGKLVFLQEEKSDPKPTGAEPKKRKEKIVA
jgi:ATP-dependent Clp protease ATP-binding subunit ClpA